MVIEKDNNEEINDNEIEINDSELKVIEKKDFKTPILSLVVLGILGLGGYSYYVTDDLSKTKSSLVALDNNTKELKKDFEKIDFDKYTTKEEVKTKQKELDKSINTNIIDLKSLQDKQENDVKELRTYIDSKFDNLTKLIKQSNESKIEYKKIEQTPNIKLEQKTNSNIETKNIEVVNVFDTANNINTNNEVDTYICFYDDKDYCKAFAMENKSEYFKMGNKIYKTFDNDVYECDMNIHDKPSCNYQAYINKKSKFKIGYETYRVVDHNTYRLLTKK